MSLLPFHPPPNSLDPSGLNEVGIKGLHAGKGAPLLGRLCCEPHSLMTDRVLCLETLAVIVPRSHSMSPGGVFR